MPPRKIKFVKKTDYHIYNRGFLRMKIFRSDRDVIRFVNKLYKYSSIFGFLVRRCAIMENHFHMLLHTNASDEISQFMLKLQQSYATYFNIKYRRRGPVFDGRFNAKPVNDIQYLETLKKYIAENPSKVLTDKPFDKHINSSFCGPGHHIKPKYCPGTKSPGSSSSSYFTSGIPCWANVTTLNFPSSSFA